MQAKRTIHPFYDIHGNANRESLTDTLTNESCI